jgi:uncharacterized LabA/DUF88 family protein
MIPAPDAVLLVDADYRNRLAALRGQPIDPYREAQGLNLVTNPLGRQPRRLAIVGEDDLEAQIAYRQAQYETVCVNGNRAVILDELLGKIADELAAMPPRHLVLVTADARFRELCCRASALPGVGLTVWAPLADAPAELTDPRFDYRPLEEMLPGVSLLNVDVRLDFENLYRALIDLGWQLDLPALVAAIRAAAGEFGRVVRLYAYADWHVLAEKSGCDLQYELAKLGVRTSYEISIPGKNSSDMSMAGDIDLLLMRPGNAPDGADVILLGSLDRDFRSTIERARASKRIVVLGLRNAVSCDLRLAAGQDIRYLDERLALPEHRAGAAQPDDVARLVLHAAAWLQERGWRFGEIAQLDVALAEQLGGSGHVARGLTAGVFETELQARTRSVRLARQHPTVQAATYLMKWAPDRIRYCLRQPGRETLNTGFLHTGMKMDERCRSLGIGQTRANTEAWLNLLADAGFLSAHPHDPRDPLPASPGGRRKQETPFMLRVRYFKRRGAGTRGPASTSP